MFTRWQTSGPAALRNVAVAASILALATLLTFPILRAHHFTARFRTSQALSQIQRHIFVAQPKAGPVVLPASLLAISRLLASTEAPCQTKPMESLPLGEYVPLTRLLLRLRLGSSHKSLSDPLL